MNLCQLALLRHCTRFNAPLKLVPVKSNQCMYSSHTPVSRDTSLSFTPAPKIKKEVTVDYVTPSAPQDLPQWDMENPFQREKQSCILCKYKITPDYKNVKLLSQFVSRFTGRIYGRHITRLCKSKQEAVEKEIWKAQMAGFMPNYFRDLHFTDDPKLFNPERPVRPHKY
ncbi:small ribosomal subunit protein bS18m [Bemisia tabaci]|uniref:small ribosomal subunit protein bS18m n=1 Tax=Bemisia tabaci TaxID=7038 RepID=UPI0008F9861A|nr:PREDICTED: 28S ribosomal protein S18c, mitochondrial [Bemisia tabaci]